MSNEKIRVGLIGAGVWGRQHARIFSQRDDVDFCAVVGRTKERVRARAAEYGVRGYVAIDEMLEREQPTWWRICLPNPGALRTNTASDSRGQRLLVEKPLVFDLQEADHLVNKRANSSYSLRSFQSPLRKAVGWQASDRRSRLGQLVFATWRLAAKAPGS